MTFLHINQSLQNSDIPFNSSVALWFPWNTPDLLQQVTLLQLLDLSGTLVKANATQANVWTTFPEGHCPSEQTNTSNLHPKKQAESCCWQAALLSALCFKQRCFHERTKSIMGAQTNPTLTFTSRQKTSNTTRNWWRLSSHQVGWWMPPSNTQHYRSIHALSVHQNAQIFFHYSFIVLFTTIFIRLQTVLPEVIDQGQITGMESQGWGDGQG